MLSLLSLLLLIGCDSASVVIDDTAGTDHSGDVGSTSVDDDNDGYTEEEGDCNDADLGTHPGATDQVNDGIDQNCDRPEGELCTELNHGHLVRPGNDNGDGYDGDGDCYADEVSGGYDCDDSDPQTYPYAPEIWYDRKAQDCSVAPDVVWDDCDADGDGVDAYAEGFCEPSATNTDCDDSHASINPWAVEDNTNESSPGHPIDDNCNGYANDFGITVIWDVAEYLSTFVFTVRDDNGPMSFAILPVAGDVRNDVVNFQMSSGAVSTAEADTYTATADEVEALVDVRTTLTYKFVSAYPFATFGDADVLCVVWGPRATEWLESETDCVDITSHVVGPDGNGSYSWNGLAG